MLTRSATLVLALLPFPGVADQPDPRPPPEPPSRALLRELCGMQRLAGTSGSILGARWVANHLSRIGWEVELDEREVMLSLPRRLEVGFYENARAERPFARRIETFDPDRTPPGDVPPFSAWSPSAEVRGPVVDVGYGLRADFEELERAGVDLVGAVALVRYGRSYRGVKVEAAAGFGCAGVLLFSDPEDDGPGRGETWPRDRWKPEWAAQRGSISPMARSPGDPSTPGWASGAPGASVERLADGALREVLPQIPCLPIRLVDARLLLDRLPDPRSGKPDAETVVAHLAIVQPLEVRRIVNVIGTLQGQEPGRVIGGNHRDAWVRGAHDAGSGTVSLLRAAQHLGERSRGGWTPKHTIQVAFWDAEEYGLIGSTEWGEAHAEVLRQEAIAYVNADAIVSGTRFGASGTPGLLGALSRTLARVAAPGADGPVGADGKGTSLLEQWRESSGESDPSLGLPGSGSDFAVFLHHLGVPVLDLSFSGNGGGQYHTRFDDFALVDRFLDPGFVGHETAGRLLAQLLGDLADAGAEAFDGAEAARNLAALVLALGRSEDEPWFGAERGERLAESLLELASAYEESDPRDAPPFYIALEDTDGLEGRPWFRNRLWAPGLETGYSAELLPGLRSAARAGPEALEAELSSLIAAVLELARRVRGG